MTTAKPTGSRPVKPARSSRPITAVPASTTAPARNPVGCARTTGVTQAATSPTANGATVPSRATASPGAAWLTRPTAAKTTTATASAASASAVIRRVGMWDSVGRPRGAWRSAAERVRR